MRKIKEAVEEWCQGKNGYVRIPFLIFFAYILLHHRKDPVYTGIFGGINLGIHEFGHLIFSPLGLTANIAGGTIVQLLAPLYGIYNFIKLDDYFSTTLCLGWLSTNFYHIATYVSDARSMSLPLVSPFGGGGGHTYHDWNYLLSKLGILSRDTAIAGFFRGCGVLSMAVCLGAGAWMIWLMITRKPIQPTRLD